MENPPEEKWCVLSSCCGCIELQLGSLLIGYFGFFITFLSMVLYVAAVILMTTSFSIHNLLEHFTDWTLLLTIYTVILTVYMILTLIMFLLLIIGSIKKRPKYLKIFFGIGCLILSINSLYFIQSFSSEAWYACAFLFVSMTILSYVLIVVRSTYLLMDKATVPKFIRQNSTANSSMCIA